MPRRKDNAKFTAVEKAFIAEYCKCLNAIEAYMRIRGIESDDREARLKYRSRGSQIKNRPHVLDEINRRLGEKNSWANEARRTLIETLVESLRTNPSDFAEVTEDGEILPKNLDEIPKEKLSSLQSLTYTTFKGGSKISFKQVDKGGAMKLLADLLGMRKDNDKDDSGELENAGRTVKSRFIDIEKRSKMGSPGNEEMDEAGES